MASHFKEPEEKPRRGRGAVAGAHTPVSSVTHTAASSAVSHGRSLSFLCIKRTALLCRLYT